MGGLPVKQQIIPITGGLNLVSDPVKADPGSAQDMLNYEVVTVDGVRRIEGFTRYDGRRDWIYRPRFAAASTDEYLSSPIPVVGDVATITLTTDSNAQVQYSALVVQVTTELDLMSGYSTSHILTLVLGEVFDIENPLPSFSQITWSGGTLTDAGILAPIDTDIFSAAGWESYYPYAEQAFRNLITHLPGDSLTRIPGLHFFNNRLYAVVDLVALRVNPEPNGVEIMEGARLYVDSQAAALGTIAVVRPAGAKDSLDIEFFDWAGKGDLSAALLYALPSSSNLAINGQFSLGAGGGDGWTAGAGWIIGAGKATATMSSAALTNAMTVVAGRMYEVTYTVANRTVGAVTVSIGGASGTARSTNATFTETIVATGTGALTFTGSGFSGEVDNVKVIELGEDFIVNGGFDGGTGWSVGPGWSILGGVAKATLSSSGLINSGVVVSGVTYKVTYTVTRTAGAVQVEMGGATGASRTASGVYVDYLTTVSTTSMEIVASGFSGTVDNISAVPVRLVGEVQSHINPTRATIYYTDWNGSGGWARQDLGRVVPYREDVNGAAFFLAYQRTGFQDALATAEKTDTGWIGADGWNTTGTGAPWTASSGQTDLQTDDGVVVSAGLAAPGSGYSDTLRAFWSPTVLSIPSGALVTGIEIRVRRGASATFGVTDQYAAIGIGGDVGDPLVSGTTSPQTKPQPGYWAQAETTVTYGGQLDTWGLELRPADINSGGLHFLLRVVLWANTGSAQVDQVEIKVHYQNQTRKAFVYDAGQTPTDREIEVIHYTVNSGNATDHTREGVLVLNSAFSPPHVDNEWQFGVGQKVYTQAAAGGSLMAELTGADVPITLASSYAVAAESARYQFESANPYAADLLDVVFIVSGAEHAVMFDSEYALPIATGLLSNFEKPRHVAWAHNFLALGYRAGTVQVSDLGNPLTWVSDSSLAAEIGAGRRITGLLPMKGNSLGVWTDQSIFVLQGSDPATLTRQDISLDSGAIEYTVVNMGQPMFADYRGVGTLSTTDQYGDFQAGRLTWASTPWLLERLQSDNSRVAPLLAFPVRNKNQYRLVFADGYIHTTTIKDPDGQPVNTLQRYYGDWQDIGNSAIKLLALAIGTTNAGRDVIFASFDSDPASSRYRYVFQLDQGRSFDGEEIFATWTGQPLQLGSPFQFKQFQQLGVLGKAYGYATFGVFSAPDFSLPIIDALTVGADSTETVMTFGTTGAMTTAERYFRDYAPKRGNAQDTTLAFKSVSAVHLPHTIQTIVVRFDPEEASN